MELLEYRKEMKDGKVRLVGTCRSQVHDRVFDLFYEYPEEYEAYVKESPDPFVPPLLVASLIYDEKLKVPFPISKNLFDNLEMVQDIFCNWFPVEARKIFVDALWIKEPELSHSGKGVLAFFSGGVDSFYTLLKSIRNIPTNTPAITHLIYMRGIEVPISDTVGGDQTIIMVKKVAEEAGLPIIIGATNLREQFNLWWADYLCGPGLASVGLSLGKQFSHVLIPGAYSYSHEDMFPESSHPLLDNLWSTEYTRFSHSGAEAHRIDKFAWLVGRDPLALQYLRVCLENKGGPTNCGKCSKCVVAMIALQSIGTLKQCATLPHKFDYRLIKSLHLKDYSDITMLKECRDLAIMENNDPKLTKKLKAYVRKHEIIEGLQLILGERGYEIIISPWRFLKKVLKIGDISSLYP